MASEYPADIIVIDNGSTDGTADLIRTKLEKVQLIELDKNLGFGAANNIGLKRALDRGADYIFLLNQDTWVQPGSIGELVKVAAGYPAYGILSPFHLAVTEYGLEPQFSGYLSFADQASLFSDMYFKQLKPVYDTSYIHAAAWFMTAACVRTTGGFSPLFHHYGEDDDYLERARYFKFKTGLVPSSLVVHDNDHKSWERLEWDPNRNRITAYLQLNKMSPHFRSNLLVWMKSAFDELTGLLVFRKFKKFFFKCGVHWQVLKKMRTVYRLHKQSFREGAFLQ